MTYRIPFNKPFIVGKELYYVAQSVLDGQISGDGPYTKKAQKLLQDVFGANQILLTTSCTAALRKTRLRKLAVALIHLLLSLGQLFEFARGLVNLFVLLRRVALLQGLVLALEFV